MQQYVGIYLLQNYSTCFESPSHPSSGVHKIVTAASGTGHLTYLSNNLPPAWPNQFYVLLLMYAIDTRNIQSSFAVNKYSYVHTFASCWILLIYHNFVLPCQIETFDIVTHTHIYVRYMTHNCDQYLCQNVPLLTFRRLTSTIVDLPHR